MYKLLVFCGSQERTARDEIEQRYGIPHKYCKFIVQHSDNIRGFADMKCVSFRPLDDYELEYARSHNITEANDDELLALQFEVTGQPVLDEEQPPELTPEQAAAVMAAFATITELVNKVLPTVLNAIYPIVKAYNSLPADVKAEIAKLQVDAKERGV